MLPKAASLLPSAGDEVSHCPWVVLQVLSSTLVFYSYGGKKKKKGKSSLTSLSCWRTH